VGDGGADLALDVVADDGDACRLKAGSPLGVRGDEHRNGVHERHARLETGFGVVPLSLFRPDREVGHQHVSAAGPQDLGDVDGGFGGLLTGCGVELAEPVEGGRPVHDDAEMTDLGELDGVVL
jgi:hypothetical protein